MRKRVPKEDDQKRVDWCYKTLLEEIVKYPEVESALWVGAFWSLIVNRYQESGATYEEFCSECEDAVRFLRGHFDQ